MILPSKIIEQFVPHCISIVITTTTITIIIITTTAANIFVVLVFLVTVLFVFVITIKANINKFFLKTATFRYKFQSAYSLKEKLI